MKRTLSRRQILIGIGVATGACAAATAPVVWELGDAIESTRPVEIAPVSASDMPTIVSRADWGAQLPNHAARNETDFFGEDNPLGWRVYEDELHTHYQTLVVHHSVIYEATDLATVREVQRFHQETRGWADVGYHFLIGKSGTIYEGRDWGVRGTHVGGYNTGSLGVCLLGNFMHQTVTQAQRDAATALVVWASERLQLTHIAGHRHFNDGTVCPGDDLFNLIDPLAEQAELSVGTEGYIPPTLACTCGQDGVI